MSSIQSILHPAFQSKKVSVSVKRDDQVHPIISGNKWYKLQYHLDAVKQDRYDYLASFGGAYSNHLHALAYAGQKQGVPTLGFVRGEQILPLNPTLKDCVRWGMTLIPLARQEYQLKQESQIVQSYLQQYEKIYVVPEGGSGLLGVRGAMEILSPEQVGNFDRIIVAAGTGTTAAGIIASIPESVRVDIMAVLNAKLWLQDEIENYLEALGINHKQWRVLDDYTFGGYAKRPKKLLAFIEAENEFLPLEPIYTGKAWYGLHDMIQNEDISAHERVLFIHTGGLQGWR